MAARIVTIAAECLIDLGVTVVYATLAGFAIAAVTVSDAGLPSLLPALTWAALLPLAVLVLILVDSSLRALAEHRAARRATRRHPGLSTERFPGARRSALR